MGSCTSGFTCRRARGKPCCAWQESIDPTTTTRSGRTRPARDPGRSRPLPTSCPASRPRSHHRQLRAPIAGKATHWVHARAAPTSGCPSTMSKGFRSPWRCPSALPASRKRPHSAPLHQRPQGDAANTEPGLGGVGCVTRPTEFTNFFATCLWVVGPWDHRLAADRLAGRGSNHREPSPVQGGWSRHELGGQQGPEVIAENVEMQLVATKSPSSTSGTLPEPVADERPADTAPARPRLKKASDGYSVVETWGSVLGTSAGLGAATTAIVATAVSGSLAPFPPPSGQSAS